MNLILPTPIDTKLHPYDPGNQVYLKGWKSGSLQDQRNPTWTGPHLVLLTTHFSLKLRDTPSCIYHSQVKPALSSSDNKEPDPQYSCTLWSARKLL